jgi:alpha-galactosidase
VPFLITEAMAAAAAVLLAVACAAAAMIAGGECGRVVHVGEEHRRSMLANGLATAPPMG